MTGHAVSRTGLQAGRHLFLALLAFGALLPVYFMISNAFKSSGDYANNHSSLPTSPTLENFRVVVSEPLFGRWILNSAILTISAVGFELVISCLAAYAFSRIAFRGRETVFRLVTALMAVPVIAVIIPLFEFMVNIGLINSYRGVVLVYSAFMIPYTTYFLTAFFRQLPDSLFEAAKLDGCGHLRMLSSIMVPLSIPALITLGVVNALWAWNELLIALVLLQEDSKRTLMVGLTVFQNQYSINVPVTMAGLCIAALPIIVLYIGGMRYFVNGLLVGGTHGE